jgi:NADPH2:quinone reductase
MHAIRIDRIGGPDVLEFVDVPAPTPGPDQVLIRQRAAGVNYIDVYLRSGLYPLKPPVILGREGAGAVEAVGANVTEFAVGDRVAYTNGTPGAYAELNAVNASEVVAIPSGVDDDVACALMLQGMTAHYLVSDVYPLRKGSIALIHAAAGGVGGLLVQLAKARGATVIATVGTDAKAALAREAGADHVIVYAEEDFAAAIERIVGHTVDVAYDSVGKETWERSLSVLRPRGMLVNFGNASGPMPAIEPQRLSQAGSIFFTRPTLVDFIRLRAERVARAKELFDLVLAGTLHVRIGAVYPLAGAEQAHRDLEARKTTGKLILRP